jgi:hypothetical protein
LTKEDNRQQLSMVYPELWKPHPGYQQTGYCPVIRREKNRLARFSGISLPMEQAVTAGKSFIPGQEMLGSLATSILPNTLFEERVRR